MKVYSARDIRPEGSDAFYPAGTEFQILALGMSEVAVVAPDGAEYHLPRSAFRWPGGAFTAAEARALGDSEEAKAFRVARDAENAARRAAEEAARAERFREARRENLEDALAFVRDAAWAGDTSFVMRDPPHIFPDTELRELGYKVTNLGERSDGGMHEFRVAWGAL